MRFRAFREVAANPFLAWAAYLVLILLLATLPNGLSTEYRFLGGTVSVLASADDVVRIFPHADVASYARAGKEIAQHGWFKDPSYDLLWAPGMPLLYAAAIVLLGDSGPSVLALALLTAFSWAAVLALLKSILRARLPAWIAWPAPLALLALPFVRTYLLRDGLLSSESLSIAFWTLGFLTLFRSILKPNWSGPLLAGALLAVAAYIRGQIDLLVLIAGAIIVVDIALLILHRWRVSGEALAASAVNVMTSRELRAVLLALLAFAVATLPYRVHKVIKHGTPMMSAADYYYKYLFLHPEEYAPVAGFILSGGGPVGCHVDPGLCKELREQRAARGTNTFSWDFYKRLAVATVLAHPAAWIKYRLAHLPPYWFSEPSSVSPSGRDSKTGYALALAFFASLALIVPLLRRRLGTVLGFGLIMAYVGHFVIFLFIHYEVRYLYLVQLAAPLFCLLAIVAWMDTREELQAALATFRARLLGYSNNNEAHAAHSRSSQH